MGYVNDDYKMPFGKHRGKALRDVPADYLLWFVDQDWAPKWADLYAWARKNTKHLNAEMDAICEDAEREMGVYPGYLDK